MKTTFIYILIDPRNNQIRYVGKANNPKKRLEGHLGDKRKTYKTNWIKNLKSKELRPVIEIIDEVALDEWQFWEQHYISLYKSWGFKLTNATIGGEGAGEFGINFTPEIRLKMRLAKLGKPSLRKGKKVSEEGKAKMSKAREGKSYEDFYGKEKAIELKQARKLDRLNKSYEEIYGAERAEEIKHKQSIAEHPSHEPWNKGLTYSKERIDQMSKIGKELMKSKKRRDQIRQSVLQTLEKKKAEGFRFKQQRSIEQIDIKTGEVVKIWDSAKSAELFFGKEKADNIGACARGKQNKAYGFKWQFVGETIKKN